MSLRRLIGAVLAALVLSACQSTADRESVAQLAGEWTAAVEGDVSRYILVTVRNPPMSLNVRAGSTGRDYGDPGSYGATPRARADVRELSSQYSLQLVDAWPIEVLQVHCVVYSTAADANIDELVSRLRGDRRVESAQALNSFSAQTSDSVRLRVGDGSEPYAHLQPNLTQLHVLQAHSITRGAGVRVAVIDTGIDANHPDLKGRIAAERDLVGGAVPGAVRSSSARGMSAERHGTAVAGVIAALDNNREGIIGVAPAASVLALRACWPAQTGGARAMCNTFTLAQALSAAIELHADVVNLSLSGPNDPLLERLVNAGVTRGIVYVGAMPPPPTAPLGFPASVPAVIRVDTTASSSKGIDLVKAPGTDILTLTPSRGYDFLSGSSLAAASVSGGIALLKAHQPKLNRALLVDALARSMSTRTDTAASVNFCAALSIVDKDVRCERE